VVLHSRIVGNQQKSDWNLLILKNFTLGFAILEEFLVKLQCISNYYSKLNGSQQHFPDEAPIICQ
jgi:hypothetical protein